jgi:hypothetical protein
MKAVGGGEKVADQHEAGGKFMVTPAGPIAIGNVVLNARNPGYQTRDLPGGGVLIGAERGVFVAMPPPAGAQGCKGAMIDGQRGSTCRVEELCLIDQHVPECGCRTRKLANLPLHDTDRAMHDGIADRHNDN